MPDEIKRRDVQQTRLDSDDIHEADPENYAGSTAGAEAERTSQRGASGSMGPDTAAEDVGPADIATERSDPEAGSG